MGWVRIDDQFDEHPKMIMLGPVVWGVWLAALTYANRYLTDGFVTDARVQRITGYKGVNRLVVVTALVDSGLWLRVDGGYQIHDYDHYQPTRAHIKQQRAKATDRIARWRGRNASVTPLQERSERECNAVGNAAPSSAVSNAAPNPNPKNYKNHPSAADTADTEFEKFWNWYPKRAGDNPKAKTRRNWNARRAENVEPEAMIEGAKRYTKFLEATGKVGTEFVLQAATFLGKDRRFEAEWKTPGPAPGSEASRVRNEYPGRGRHGTNGFTQAGEVSETGTHYWNEELQRWTPL